MSSVTSTPGTTLRVKYRDIGGTDRDVPFPLVLQKRTISRALDQANQTLFLENFENGRTGFLNDGVGAVYVDPTIRFNGHPSLCVDPLGSITSNTTPTTVPDTNGVVSKRRFGNLISGKYGMEGYLFFSSNGLTVNNQKSISIYNRDGTNIHIGRIWFDTPVATSVDLKFLESDGTWSLIETYGGAWGGHAYDPSIDSYDEAGIWNYFKLVVDFDTKKYVAFQWNEKDYTSTVSSKSTRTEANTSNKAMHFSFEMGNRSTAARRYYHLGEVTGFRQ